MGRAITPSQTIGPFFHRALLRTDAGNLTSENPSGTPITLEGRVLDGDGQAVSDAMVEIWQADAAGHYDHPADSQSTLVDRHFHGYGRVGTDAEGQFRFRTIRPGAVRDGDLLQAPHINLTLFARGLLHHLVTRVYFPDERLNATDPVLALVPSERRQTLIARPEPPDGQSFRFDIVLQGINETVFFDI